MSGLMLVRCVGRFPGTPHAACCVHYSRRSVGIPIAHAFALQHYSILCPGHHAYGSVQMGPVALLGTHHQTNESPRVPLQPLNALAHYARTTAKGLN